MALFASPPTSDPRGASPDGREFSWKPGRPVDLAATLGTLRHGGGDPAMRIGPGGVWWTPLTPLGPGTLHLRARGQVTATAWGPGAPWLLDQVPALLGDTDDWSGLDLTAVPMLADVLHRLPGLRLTRTARVLDSLVPAVLEQRVTGGQARQSWRALLNGYGTPAPGPAGAAGMRVPPPPQTLLDITTWQWHRMGVEQARQRPIRAGGTVAGRLEECVALTGEQGARRLAALPGIGPWTTAETLQRACGDPDVVSVGDYHLHDLVVFALTGRPRGDDTEMLELLEPWTGQRQRIVRLIELSPVRKPRHGPRYAPLDIRAL